MKYKIFEILVQSVFIGVIGAIILYFIWPSEVKSFIKSLWEENPTEIITTPSP